MTRYLARRLLQSLVLMFLVVTAVFFIFQVMPGDVTTIFIQPDIPPEVRENMIRRLGLDRPAHEQFGVYLRRLAAGDLGVAFPSATFRGSRPVLEIVAERLPRTILLFTAVVIVNYTLGFMLGKRIAWRRGKWSEYAATITGVTLLNVFTPVAALFLLWVFALQAGYFPFGGWQDYARWRPFVERGLTSNDVFVPMIVTGLALIAWVLLLVRATREIDRRRVRQLARGGGVLVYAAIVVAWWWRAGLGILALDILQHMTLPLLTLVAIGFAGPMLVMRDSMLETMREDFVLTARAKGLKERVVRDKHAARTALLPIVTSFALAIALAVDGAIITETMFSWPGMGHALLRSVLEKNFPVAMGVVLVLSAAVLIAHLVVDLLYAWLDPRVSHG
jgi:peptide/nickel transport system permease protein